MYRPWANLLWLHAAPQRARCAAHRPRWAGLDDRPANAHSPPGIRGNAVCTERCRRTSEHVRVGGTQDSGQLCRDDQGPLSRPGRVARAAATMFPMSAHVAVSTRSVIVREIANRRCRRRCCCDATAVVAARATAAKVLPRGATWPIGDIFPPFAALGVAPAHKAHGLQMQRPCIGTSGGLD
jgi:hypothetical protein